MMPFELLSLISYMPRKSMNFQNFGVDVYGEAARLVSSFLVFNMFQNIDSL